jgi:hypothetical protein
MRSIRIKKNDNINNNYDKNKHILNFIKDINNNSMDNNNMVHNKNNQIIKNNLQRKLKLKKYIDKLYDYLYKNINKLYYTNINIDINYDYDYDIQNNINKIYSIHIFYKKIIIKISINIIDNNKIYEINLFDKNFTNINHIYYNNNNKYTQYTQSKKQLFYNILDLINFK